MEYSFASNGTRFDVTTDSKSITVKGVGVSGNTLMIDWLVFI